ncbi:MAG: UDP-N-acetylglucosamine pyrophosphorylase [Bacteroidetes bacterium]|nr:UDP-N-acetylglucosamine pyrophosphorylase [Bacteroidota bacterium]
MGESITNQLFDLNHTLFPHLFQNEPWSVLNLLENQFDSFISELPNTYVEWKPGVWIAENVSIAPTAFIEGPAIIGSNTDIRHSAYVRKNVVIGNHCVVGNSTEVKNAILFDEVQIPHFNYVGDSILGFKAHLGAGAILSNFRFDGKNIAIRSGRAKFNSGRNKLGSFIGDFAEIGANCVILPGTVIGKNAQIYPLVNTGGFIPAHAVIKKSIFS